MYFAQLYPYTFSDLQHSLADLRPLCQPFVLCKSLGGLDVPAIFWDAEIQQCVDLSPIIAKSEKVPHTPPEIRTESETEFSPYIINFLRNWGWRLKDDIPSDFKPVIVIAARQHPSESNSSFAVEGLIQAVFADNDFGVTLRHNFSWFIIPMMNPDGVVCGLHRPSLSGDDINRVWGKPDREMHPVVTAVLDTLTILHRDRPIPFFLDFHGYPGEYNSFVYGSADTVNPQFRNVDEMFPRLMCEHSEIFDFRKCLFAAAAKFECTMKMTLRRRFHILFAYVMEMSFGGCDLRPPSTTHFTPQDYRSLGEATTKSIACLFLD
jgi:hypothetical protein